MSEWIGQGEGTKKSKVQRNERERRKVAGKGTEGITPVKVRQYNN